MSKRITVFYSWQSDTPSSFNRRFIEDALRGALKRLKTNATVEIALRDAAVELDKDTQGVAGSPPIAETILRKIEDCAVFVADLTFVGESKTAFKSASRKPRQFPNPNVSIEYGYALRCHSHSKLIGIMNTVYGKPEAESLPFDLRHLRWPITYSSDDKSDGQFNTLIAKLAEAIGLILSKPVSQAAPIEKFVPQMATKNVADFYQDIGDLVGEYHAPFTAVEGAKAFLRLYPTVAVSPIGSELEAVNLARQSGLRPLGAANSWNTHRNAFGAIVCQVSQTDALQYFTQLFLSRELWGVDAVVLNVDHIRGQLQSMGSTHLSPNYIATGYVEQQFVIALSSYLRCAQHTLNIAPPLQVEAGLVGIKGYSLAISTHRTSGKTLRDSIIWRGTISSYEPPAYDDLAPFFDRLWNECGIPRPAQAQTELAKYFSSARV